jgi:peroxiredoxin
VLRLPSSPRPGHAATAAPAQRRRYRLGLALLAGAVVLAASGCEGGPIGQSTPLSNGASFVSGSGGTTVFAPGSRSPAPKITAKTLTGQKVSLASYRGSVLVLNFWGSWCTPCREEGAALGALARHFRADGVRFLGVDIRDTPASAEAYMRQFRISYPSINDPGDQIALEFRSSVLPSAIPSTLVIDRSGHIAARVIGGITYNGLGRLLRHIAAERR